MHPQAEKWDRKFGNSVNYHKIIGDKFVPRNRPCDWCGQPVSLGYIHKECQEKEAKKYIDILY